MKKSWKWFRIGPIAGVPGAALWITLVTLLTPAVKGQGFGPDPFRPYNSQYDAFVYPIAPGPLDYGPNIRAQSGIRGANQFESYMNSLRGQGGAQGTGGGPGTPYFRANRAYDREYGRIYQPNKEADASFQSNQDIVNDLYFKYLRERDPKKRAELFRDYNRARARADRELHTPRGLSSHAGARSARTGNEARSARTAEGSIGGVDDRPPPSTPPPTSAPARSPSATARRAASTGLDEPPSPLGDSSASGTPSRSQTPSQVLDRATRAADRMRLGPRPRVAPPTSTPLEPPVP
ncbi:MAG: hypothetical protein ACLP7Q_05790 [Isosphaeraceae bacterium]